jgi:glycine/D-amino acid oxidase-like deaminating enzyme
MADPRQRVIVIGGGISGLACAYRLQQLGVAVTIPAV